MASFNRGQTFDKSPYDYSVPGVKALPSFLGPQDDEDDEDPIARLAAERAASKMTLAPIEPPRPAPTPGTLGAPAAPGGAVAPNAYTGGDGWRRGLSAAESWIIQRESGFNPAARNKSSGAFGLWQGLGSTLTGQARKHGFDPYTTDPNQQLVMFRDYVKGRYGSAERAVDFWRKHGWY